MSSSLPLHDRDSRFQSADSSRHSSNSSVGSGSLSPPTSLDSIPISDGGYHGPINHSQTSSHSGSLFAKVGTPGNPLPLAKKGVAGGRTRHVNAGPAGNVQATMVGSIGNTQVPSTLPEHIAILPPSSMNIPQPTIGSTDNLHQPAIVPRGHDVTITRTPSSANDAQAILANPLDDLQAAIVPHGILTAGGTGGIPPTRNGPPVSVQTAMGDPEPPAGDPSGGDEPPTDDPDKIVPVRELLGLANPGSGYPAATEAIRYLLQAVGRDVVSFRRNTQVSYMFVERARDLVNAINKYIEKVENSSDPDWDSFMKFTTAIEPLEDILFKLLAFTEDEKEGYFSSTQSVTKCITSVESWAKNREELLDALETVDTRQELVSLLDQPRTALRKEERQEAQSHDDRTLLIEIRDTIDKLVHNKKFPAYVTKVRTSLETLQAEVIRGSHPDWLTVFTVKTSMLVHGVLEISRTAEIDRKVLGHLRSKAVWVDAFALIDALLSEDESQDTLPQGIKEKYDRFILTLKGASDVSLPQSYVELMKQAGRIRRPFQAQAFAFVMLCRALAEKFTAVADSSITDENITSVENAFNETLAALKAAEKAVSALQNFDLTNFTQDATIKAFSVAESLLEESFKSFNLDAEWPHKQTDISSAFKRDMERMAQLNESFRKPKSLNTTVSKIWVNVRICDQRYDGTVLVNASVEGESTMRLSALRWSVAGALEGEHAAMQARSSGTFYQLKNNQWSEIQDMQATLEEIANEEEQIRLRLVVPELMP